MLTILSKIFPTGIDTLIDEYTMTNFTIVYSGEISEDEKIATSVLMPDEFIKKFHIKGDKIYIWKPFFGCDTASHNKQWAG